MYWDWSSGSQAGCSAVLLHTNPLLSSLANVQEDGMDALAAAAEAAPAALAAVPVPAVPVQPGQGG